MDCLQQHLLVILLIYAVASEPAYEDCTKFLLTSCDSNKGPHCDILSSLCNDLLREKMTATFQKVSKKKSISGNETNHEKGEIALRSLNDTDEIEDTRRSGGYLKSKFRGILDADDAPSYPIQLETRSKGPTLESLLHRYRTAFLENKFEDIRIWLTEDGPRFRSFQNYWKKQFIVRASQKNNV